MNEISVGTFDREAGMEIICDLLQIRRLNSVATHVCNERAVVTSVSVVFGHNYGLYSKERVCTKACCTGM